MPRLVKFKELETDWDDNNHINDIYIDLDSVKEIRPYKEELPEYCDVYLGTLNVVTVLVSMDHMAELVNGTYVEDDTANVLAKTIRSKCEDKNEDGSRTVEEVLTDVLKQVNKEEPNEELKILKIHTLDDILTYTGPCLRCNTMPWWEWNNYAGYETYTLSIHCHCAEASGTGKLGDDAVKLGWELAKKWKTKTSTNTKI